MNHSRPPTLTRFPLPQAQVLGICLLLTSCGGGSGRNIASDVGPAKDRISNNSEGERQQIRPNNQPIKQITSPVIPPIGATSPTEPTTPAPDKKPESGSKVNGPIKVEVKIEDPHACNQDDPCTKAVTAAVQKLRKATPPIGKEGETVLVKLVTMSCPVCDPNGLHIHEAIGGESNYAKDPVTGKAKAEDDIARLALDGKFRIIPMFGNPPSEEDLQSRLTTGKSTMDYYWQENYPKDFPAHQEQIEEMYTLQHDPEVVSACKGKDFPIAFLIAPDNSCAGFYAKKPDTERTLKDEADVSERIRKLNTLPSRQPAEVKPPESPNKIKDTGKPADNKVPCEPTDNHVPGPTPPTVIDDLKKVDAKIEGNTSLTMQQAAQTLGFPIDGTHEISDSEYQTLTFKATELGIKHIVVLRTGAHSFGDGWCPPCKRFDGTGAFSLAGSHSKDTAYVKVFSPYVKDGPGTADALDIKLGYVDQNVPGVFLLKSNGSFQLIPHPEPQLPHNYNDLSSNQREALLRQQGPSASEKLQANIDAAIGR